MKQNTYFHVRFKWQNHISVMFKIYNCEKTLSFFLQKERKTLQIEACNVFF